jgi:hypothetical protein
MNIIVETPSTFSFFGLVFFALIALISHANAQSDYWSAKYSSAMVTSPTPLTVTINGADSWSVGTVNHYVLTSNSCSAYFLTITKGAAFLQVAVTNPNFCTFPNCYYYYSYCQSYSTPSGWSSYQNVYPFQIEWWDVSTSASYAIPSRQNVPVGMTPESTTFVIPQALPNRAITPSMQVHVTIRPRSTNLFKLSVTGWYNNFPQASTGQWKTQDYTSTLPIIGASGRLGLQYVSRGQISDSLSTYWMTNAFRRKQPTPQFYFKYMWGQGCWWSNYIAGFPTRNCGWYNGIHYFPAATDWTNLLVTCTNADCGDSYIDADGPSDVSTLAWEFYEEYRMYSNNVTIDYDTAFTTVGNPTNGYAMTVKTDGNISFSLRLSWLNITDVAPCCNFATIAALQRSYIGVFIVPPFPVQDLWITVYDENGNRIFTEVDKRVPYRGSSSVPGQPGWPLALSNRVWASKKMYVTLRWNRRNTIGTREEEIRVNQLVGFIADNGGSTSLLISPIPLTILTATGVMGVIAASPLTNGQLVGSVSFQSCMIGTMTKELLANKLLWAKLNASDLFNSYRKSNTISIFSNITNTTTNVTAPGEPFRVEQMVMTIMLTAGLPSETDQSTSFWTVFDAFYPATPTMLPAFWDSSLLNRLLGFSEIPTFCGYLAGNWTTEYNVIASLWPWYGKEVTASSYSATRAHVRRTILTSANEVYLTPYVHLFRPSSTSLPNVNFVISPSTNFVNFFAVGDIATQAELYPDFGATNFSKHEFFLRYGAVPPNANDAATLPNFDGYLDYTSASRQVMVNRWTGVFQESYKASLARAISALSQKLSNLPTVVNGLGATPDQVQMASILLNSERLVVTWQITDANAEYATLP